MINQLHLPTYEEKKELAFSVYLLKETNYLQQRLVLVMYKDTNLFILGVKLCPPLLRYDFSTTRIFSHSREHDCNLIAKKLESGFELTTSRIRIAYMTFTVTTGKNWYLNFVFFNFLKISIYLQFRILIVNLKRFKFNSEEMVSAKVAMKIKLDMTLHLDSFIAQDAAASPIPYFKNFEK